MELCLLCQLVSVPLLWVYFTSLALLLCLQLNSVWVLVDHFKEKREDARPKATKRPWG